MAIKGLLNQTLTVATKSGYDQYGRNTVSAGTDYPCRFQMQTSQELLPNGQLVVILAIAYVASDCVVDIEDKVTFDSVAYKVYGKYESIDGLGQTHHYKLKLTKWE